MNIIRKEWGTTKKGEKVYLYTLKNDFLEVEVLNYGAVIRRISAPDKDGKFEDVVLNLETIKDYEERSPYFGAVVGRNAGRIKNALLKIDGQEYPLVKNSGENSIHGGIDNFSHRIWEAYDVGTEEKPALELVIKSLHLDEGFPGNVEVRVRYTLDKNQLLLSYRGTSDRKTYLNLTNHSYFNLSGDFKRDIEDETLYLNCNEFIAVDKQTLPVSINSVKGTPFDFREGKILKTSLDADDEQIKIVNNGLDHPFIFSEDGKRPLIKLEDQKSGRVLEVETDQPAVVIYTGNYLHEVGKLNSKVCCKKHMGICFETQNYADALNFIPEKAVITSPEKPYIQETRYRFSVTK